MRKIKIFSNSSYRVVEEQINAWVADHENVDIEHILQSESFGTVSWSLTITIFYYEGEQGQ